MPLTVTWITAPDSTLATRSMPVAFDVDGALFPVVYATHGGRSEPVYVGGAFVAPFLSSAEDDGEFSVRRDRGWFGPVTMTVAHGDETESASFGLAYLTRPIAVAALLKAVRNVVTGTLESVRSVPDTMLRPGSPDAQARIAIAVDRPGFEIVLGSQTRHAQAPASVTGDRSLKVVDADLRLTYKLPTVAQEAERYDVMAAMGEDADRIVQALTFPGNLHDDGADIPTLTRAVSAMAFGPGGEGSPTTDRVDDWDSLTATTTISMSAILMVDQPTG